MNGAPPGGSTLGGAVRTGSFDDNGNIVIPEGFESVSMDSSANTLRWNDSYTAGDQWGMGLDTGNEYTVYGGVFLSILIGDQSINYFPDPSGDSRSPAHPTNNTTVNCPGLEGSQAILLKTWDVTKYDIRLTLHCKLKSEGLLKWQLPFYNSIMDAYNKQKKDYDAAYAKALADFNATKAVKHNRNPFLNRETERIELKQMAISYISCKFYDEMNAMKNKVKPCGFPQMDLEEAQREGRWVQFFEQAFEWPLMTYIFYPYFWGRKCTWEDKMKEEADDFIFEKFLQAGFAKMQVPVRPGFEAQIQYFLAFGEIWQGNDTPPLPGDPYYVSMAQEIKEEKGNFNADRLGSIAFTKDTITPNAPNDIITLTDSTAYYYNNQLNVDSDIDREIFIDCKPYRIISIKDKTPAGPNHDTWLIQIDKAYEGDNFSNLKWSTGSLFVGAAWEYTTPTQLVWLRGKVKCLPCFPLPKCVN